MPLEKVSLIKLKSIQCLFKIAATVYVCPAVQGVIAVGVDIPVLASPMLIQLKIEV